MSEGLFFGIQVGWKVPAVKESRCSALRLRARIRRWHGRTEARQRLEVSWSELNTHYNNIPEKTKEKTRQRNSSLKDLPSLHDASQEAISHPRRGCVNY